MIIGNINNITRQCATFMDNSLMNIKRKKHFKPSISLLMHIINILKLLKHIICFYEFFSDKIKTVQ